MHRRLLDYSPEAETYDTISATGVGRANPEAVFNEADEMELAVGLLGITNHAELEQFLGGVVDQASRTVGKAGLPPGKARSPAFSRPRPRRPCPESTAPSKASPPPVPPPPHGSSRRPPDTSGWNSKV